MKLPAVSLVEVYVPGGTFPTELKFAGDLMEQDVVRTLQGVDVVVQTTLSYEKKVALRQRFAARFPQDVQFFIYDEKGDDTNTTCVQHGVEMVDVKTLHGHSLVVDGVALKH